MRGKVTPALLASLFHAEASVRFADEAMTA